MKASSPSPRRIAHLPAAAPPKPSAPRLGYARAVTLALVGVALLVAGPAIAQTTYYGPLPYTSSADVPAGMYAGSPTFIEDFEDGTLDGGILSTPMLMAGGARLGSSFGEAGIDSVDADDGLINGASSDGGGNFGESWWVPMGSVRYTFTTPVTAAGVVWTDGDGDLSFEAFGPGGVSLGVHGPFSGIPDGNFLGGTAEDTFFGVTDPGGIVEIVLSSSVLLGLESDHVQYGVAAAPAAPIPTASEWALALLALALASGAFWLLRQPGS